MINVLNYMLLDLLFVLLFKYFGRFLSDFTGMAFRSGCSTGKVTHNYAIWISSVPDFAFNLGSTKEMRGR